MSSAAKKRTTSRKSYSSRQKVYPYYKRQYGAYRGRGSYKFVQAGGSLNASAKLPGIGTIGGNLQGSGGWANKAEVVPYLTGMGAYKIGDIKRNVLIKPDPPRVYNTSDGHGVTIRHREFIQNIVTSDVAGDFKIDVFPLNPGITSTFPWLSSIAPSFEEYCFEGLIFEFQSTSSDAIASSSNLALGSVMLATQYDPLNPAFNTSQSMLNYDWAENCKVSDTKMHFIECDPKQNVLGKYFVRSDAETDGADLRFTDMGNFSIATEGLQGTSVQVGRLWVTYQVRFNKPKLNINSIQTSGGQLYKYACSTGMAVSTPFGTLSAGTVLPASNLDVQLSYDSGNGRITFPDSPYGRTFQVLYANTPTSDASGVFKPPTIAGVNQCLQISILNANTQGALFAPASSGTEFNNSQLIIFYVSLLPNSVGAYADIHLENAIFGSGANKVDIIVTQIPYLDPNIY